MTHLLPCLLIDMLQSCTSIPSPSFLHPFQTPHNKSQNLHFISAMRNEPSNSNYTHNTLLPPFGVHAQTCPPLSAPPIPSSRALCTITITISPRCLSSLLCARLSWSWPLSFYVFHTYGGFGRGGNVGVGPMRLSME